MSELFERNPYYEDKIAQKEKELRYPLDIIKGKINAPEIDIKLSRREVIDIFKVCQEEGYEDAIDLLKKHTNRAGFKRVVVSPFSMNFYAVLHHKYNSCFIPSVFVPRLRNLHKIVPDLAEDGTQAVIMHEREHGRADALTSYDEEKNEKFKFIEPLTDLQKINKMAENGAGVDKRSVSEIAAKEFIYLKVLQEGAEILEGENIEKTAMDYFKFYYLFSENDASLKTFESSNNYLGEFIKYKKEGRVDEFHSIFLEEFRKIKEEVSEKYERYMEENNIPDLYDKEDRECENLRIKIINRLNQEKII